MHSVRKAFMVLSVAALLTAGLCVAGPSYAKGGSGGGAGGGGAGGGGNSGSNTKTPPKKDKTLLDQIQADTSLSKFAAALKAAEVDKTLQGAGPYTVLAPNDAAFDKDKAKLEELMKPANKAQLKAMLEGHILTSKMTAADIAKATKLGAMGGASHTVKVGDDKQTVIDGVAKISKADVAGSNGLLDVIDKVLLPADKPAPAGK